MPLADVSNLVERAPHCVEYALPEDAGPSLEQRDGPSPPECDWSPSGRPLHRGRRWPIGIDGRRVAPSSVSARSTRPPAREDRPYRLGPELTVRQRCPPD